MIGYVDDDWNEVPDGGLGLTKAGIALVTAEKRGRTTKKKAKPVIDALLGRAQALMSDGLAPRKVSKVWVFGSYVDPDKVDVGDIDIVIETYRTDVVPFREIEEHIEKHYPGYIPQSLSWHDSVEEVFIAKSIYGVRRHPLLAVTPLHTLIDLHRPCALFYDETKGGIIEPVYFDHHPESTERGDNIRERLVLPDLTARSSSFELTPAIVFDLNFGRSRREAEFSDLDWEAGSPGGHMDFFALNDFHGRRIDIHRNLSIGSSAWEYTLNTTITDIPDGSSHYDWINLGRRIVALAHADIIRMADHRHHERGMYEISAYICLDVGDHHPIRDIIEKGISKIFEEMDSSLPEGREFGIEFLCDGSGKATSSPLHFDAIHWKTLKMPFSESEYMEWAKPNHDEQDFPSRISPDVEDGPTP